MLWSNAIGNTQSSSLNGYHSHCSIIYGFVYCTSSKMNGKCNEKLHLSWIGWNRMEWSRVESSVQLFRQSRRAYRICVSFNYSLHLKDLHFLWFVVSLMNWKFKRINEHEDDTIDGLMCHGAWLPLKWLEPDFSTTNKSSVTTKWCAQRYIYIYINMHECVCNNRSLQLAQ